MLEIREKTEKIINEASRIIIGKNTQIKLIMAAIYSGGHILLDDLPGVGKTTLVKVISRIMGCGFSRVSFTPDLLPSDITGMSVFDQRSGDFTVRHGPVMTNIFLADEINRAIPRTQSALLEAMEELQITIEGITYALPSPFLVMATQNPVEMESTFKLPIAQLDRFMLRLTLGYPDHREELLMLRTVGDEIPLNELKAIIDAGEIIDFQRKIRQIGVTDNVLDYIVRVVGATRQSPNLLLPAGPRGSRALFRAGKAWAAIDGRDYVTPDDIKTLAPYILSHRLLPSQEARMRGLTAEGIVGEILEETKAPGSREEIIGAKQ